MVPHNLHVGPILEILFWEILTHFKYGLFHKTLYNSVICDREYQTLNFFFPFTAFNGNHSKNMVHCVSCKAMKEGSLKYSAAALHLAKRSR